MDPLIFEWKRGEGALGGFVVSKNVLPLGCARFVFSNLAFLEPCYTFALQESFFVIALPPPKKKKNK